ADQIYKDRRFVFTGSVIDVSNSHGKTIGQDSNGQYLYTDMGPNARIQNGHGTVAGSDIFCFFRNKSQMAQLHYGMTITFEATVDGLEPGSTNIDLTDAVLR
ncbi:MAG: hypothetical protein ACRD43_08935, partial [Pyrinomonadaceae bacterium]